MVRETKYEIHPIVLTKRVIDRAISCAYGELTVALSLTCGLHDSMLPIPKTRIYAPLQEKRF